MVAKSIKIPKKISRFGGSLAIYFDLPTIAYLDILDENGLFRPVKIRVEDEETEIEKIIRYNAKGSAIMTFTKTEIELFGLVHDDVVAFTISA